MRWHSFNRLVRGTTCVYPLAVVALIACDSPTVPEARGTLLITTLTKGLDFPTAFTVKSSALGATARSIESRGSLIVHDLPPGSYTVTLGEIPPNCTTARNPITVELTSAATARVVFDITCGAVYGALRLNVATSGEDPDPTGYKILLKGGRIGVIGANGTAVFNQIAGGSQTVDLLEIASNCRLVSPSTQTFLINVGGQTRDTATVSFNLTCTRVEKFAFRRRTTSGYGAQQVVFVAYADGSEAVSVGTGFNPVWSPLGSSLALGWVECDFYYGTPCQKKGLAIVNLDGGFALQLTTDTADADPSWRPDGDAVVFGRRGKLFVVDATQPRSTVVEVPLPATVTRAQEPSWSPDGFKIAFTCYFDNSAPDICVIAPDGSGFVRLTTDPSFDTNPEWSPDGKQIAFSTVSGANEEIALISGAGGGISRLTAGKNPAWSGDGTKILFERSGMTTGIYLFHVPSSTVVRLTANDDHEPAWRP